MIRNKESDGDGDGKTYLCNNHTDKSDVYARYLFKNNDKCQSESESYISLNKSGGNQESGKMEMETRVLDKRDESQEIGRIDESDDDESFLSCRSTSECSYYRFSAELRKCDIEY